MTGAEIRSQFIEFFRQRGHDFIPSSSLVPDKDPTLLFTNAGMVQFKHVFLGNQKLANPRAVNAQKCLRLSGKHNDLEEVGRDGYHHTFFEMLGNWSFGDYYKKDSIAWAWELITDVWKLPKDKLYATVYRTDDEAAELWRTLTDIDPTHIQRFDEKDNFWEMGEVGPCGPCSEIHIDRGPGTCDMQHVTGHVCAVNVGCARYMELWNLVFIQYNRREDRSLEELSAKHVDTGAGLERLAAVLQDVPSNYDTDLFQNIIRFTEQQCSRRYGKNEADDLAFRVIADHVRALTFLVADGVSPSNDGRGYVLRRVLRRAARHAKHLGFNEPILCRVSAAVIETMGAAYPDIIERRAHIEEVLRSEEERFGETLDKGLNLLDQEKTSLTNAGTRVLPGAVAFKLYDTFGFPLDMTQDILREDGITVDSEGFDACMAEQRQRGRDARRAGAEVLTSHGAHTSRFVGDSVYDWDSEVTALVADGGEQAEVREGSTVQVIVPETPFYGESGGQVGDHGRIETADGSIIEIIDTQKPRPELTVHIGRVLSGAVRQGERVHLRVDQARRQATRINHSATHIVHAVLRQHLGKEVHQQGSMVSPERLRFDFNFSGPVAAEVLRAMEDDVNALIRGNAAAHSEEMAFDDAIKAGALAFFGDKYGDRVRVIRFGDYSTELCGGSHVARAGDIGLFKFRSEAGVAAGVRRLEAVTGSGALQWIRAHEQTLQEVGELVRASEDDVASRVAKLVAQQRELEKQLKQLQGKLAGSQSEDLMSHARQINGITVLAAQVDGLDDAALRDLADRLREQIRSGVVVLGTAREDKVVLLAAVTKDLTKKLHAGNIIKKIAPIVGGGGGGKPDLAQAGGKDPAKLPEALEAVYQLVS